MAGREKIVVLLLGGLFLLAGCGKQSFGMEDAEEDWGSFTADQTYSYDEKYYAVQEVEEDHLSGKDSLSYYVKVCIYEAEKDTQVFCFYPARARDFWGICWEKDTYNIWVQSGDIGVYCYRYGNLQWERDESAQRPEYIISKYDKNAESSKS